MTGSCRETRRKWLKKSSGTWAICSLSIIFLAGTFSVYSMSERKT